MKSIKDTLRKTIVATMAAALMTTVFVGCSDMTESSSKDESLISTPAVTTSAVDNLVNGEVEDNTPSIVEESGVDTFSIKYKYWYDNPDIVEEQTNKYVLNGTATGTEYLDSYTVYADEGGNQYIVSGRTPVYLSNGKIAAKDFYGFLREEGTGYRKYVALPGNPKDILAEFDKMLSDCSATQPATLNERMSNTMGIHLDEKDYAVYVNNISTPNSYNPSDGLFDILNVLKSYTLGSLTTDEESGNPVLHLFTAAGKIDIEVEEVDDAYKLTYSTGEVAKDIDLTDIEIDTTRDYVGMSLDCIEECLGYDVEVYADSINIVTDNKDIFTETGNVSMEYTDLADADLNSEDTAQPIETKPVEPEPEPTTPAQPVESEPEPEPEHETKPAPTTQAPEPVESTPDTPRPAESTKPSTTTKPATTTTKPKETKPTTPTESSSESDKPNYTPTEEYKRDGDWFYAGEDGWLYDPEHSYVTPEEKAALQAKVDEIFTDPNHEANLGEGLTDEEFEAALRKKLGLDGDD